MRNASSVGVEAEHVYAQHGQNVPWEKNAIKPRIHFFFMDLTQAVKKLIRIRPQRDLKFVKNKKLKINTHSIETIYLKEAAKKFYF